jgi:radical SAM protein with 4Fe4S-binding SPASM domain
VEDNEKPLTTGEIKKILKDLADHGLKLVEFSGGEPLLAKDIMELIDYACALDLEISLVSNGTLFTDELCKRIKHAVKHVHITLRGYDAATHDGVTGVKGSYVSFIKNMKWLNQNNIAVGILFAPTYSTYRHVYQAIRDLITREGVILNNLLVNRIKIRDSSNNVEEKEKSVIDTIGDFEIVFEQLHRLHAEFGLFIEIEAFPLCEVNPKYHKYITKCNTGLTHAGVDNKGNLKLCPVSNERLGNLRDRSIKELWQNHANARYFRSMAWMDDRCRNCDLLEECAGGCWASYPEVSVPKPDYFLRTRRYRDDYIPKLIGEVILKRENSTSILMVKRRVPRPDPVKQVYGESENLVLSEFERLLIDSIDNRKSFLDIKREILAKLPADQLDRNRIEKGISDTIKQFITFGVIESNKPEDYVFDRSVYKAEQR